MEFHEKLQELRKQKGLTQEELAMQLYVSRTAVSKWESGRGYPSIDSLKVISNYFSVSIDDLLSGEKLIFIAEKEKVSFLKSNNIISVILMIVPLIIFFINIILVLTLKENFPVSLTTDILWFNEAFSYKLCDIINDAITNSNNFFVTILLFISIVLAGILETVLSLLHLVVFIVVYVLALIYGFGFQTMVGSIIVGTK